MDKAHFVQLVGELLYRTDSSTLTPDTHYKRLAEWNYILEVSFAMMIQEEYQVEVTPEDFNATTTLGELYNRVHRSCLLVER